MVTRGCEEMESGTCWSRAHGFRCRRWVSPTDSAPQALVSTAALTAETFVKWVDCMLNAITKRGEGGHLEVMVVQLIVLFAVMGVYLSLDSWRCTYYIYTAFSSINHTQFPWGPSSLPTCWAAACLALRDAVLQLFPFGWATQGAKGWNGSSPTSLLSHPFSTQHTSLVPALDHPLTSGVLFDHFALCSPSFCLFCCFLHSTQ